MSRLQNELFRLYRPTDAAPDAPADAAGLVDVQGRVRALVIELARPATWAPIAQVWSGVQSDLGLPAPAIAVNGTDGYQLWFSLNEPVPLAAGHTFLQALSHRHLQGVPAHRLRCLPELPAASATTGDGAGSAPLQAALVMPGTQTAAEQWSSFLAPDLAPLFAETPWLDLPPAEDGQAQLLAGLSSISPAAFAAALLRLAQTVPPTADSAPRHPSMPAAPVDAPSIGAGPAGEGSPQRFLLDVMNDEAAPLALRIEAAKALLPYSLGGRPPP